MPSRVFDTGYEPHVDGLRAVAVVAVLLFHLGVPGFSGGYAGVDIFLVISGYLITKKIANEVEATGRFRFGHFYMARARRILPALLATLLLCILAAGLLLPTPAAQRVGNESLAALLSVSNILFWLQSGYFDAASETKPLLHTWSLGVEEQFYLVWPAIILLLARLSNGRRLWAGIVAVGIVSLLANLYVVWARPEWLHEPVSAMFFLMPFRVYEFAIGAAGVWLVRIMPPPPLVHEGAMALGLALIAATVFLLPHDVPWPSWWALFPCLGAMLAILASRASFVGAVLTNPVAVGIGLISYSVYLVHWPLIVFYQSLTFQEPGPDAIVGLFVASLGMGFLLYGVVEQPTRRRSSWLFPIQRFAPLLVVAGVVALSSASALAAGFFGQPAKLTTAQIEAGKRARFDLTRRACRIDALDTANCRMDRPLQVLVFGNSHEPDAYNIFAELYGDSADVNLISFGTVNRCELMLDGKGLSSQVSSLGCAARATALNRKKTLARIDVVVLGLNKPFESNSQETWKILDWMKDQNPNLKIVVLGGYLNLKADCPDVSNRFGTYDACKKPSIVSAADFEGPEAAKMTQARNMDYLFIDKMALLCPDGTLVSCAVAANGEPFTYDEHHLSLPFARLVAHGLASVYGDRLQQLGFPPVDQ